MSLSLTTLLRVLALRRTLRRRDRWDRRQLEAHQAAALRDLRDFAYERSPFYRRYHEGLTRRPLHELPVLTKAQLMEHFGEIVTDREVTLAGARRHLADGWTCEQFLGRYRVDETGGSSGFPGIFVHNRREWVTVLASYARASDWAGLKAGLTRRMKLAVVSSRKMSHQSALVGETLKSPWVPTIRIDATEPLEGTLRALEAFQPESLTGYASMVRLLAEEQLAGRLKIAPKAVMSASEVLTEESARRIEQAWGRRPFNVYAATETAGIASQCDRHQGLHLYEDLVIAEPVDEHYKPAPPGTFAAKLLVTVLFSRTQPLIRYEMEDCVRLSRDACPCGRPFGLIDGIEGRLRDILAMQGSEGATVWVHPHVFYPVLDAVPASGWQVVQEEDGGLRVLVAGLPEQFNDAALQTDVVKALADHGACVPRVEVESVASIPRTPLGKAPLVRSAKNQR
jgi:putative adenylate-forming enzyme